MSDLKYLFEEQKRDKLEQQFTTSKRTKNPSTKKSRTIKTQKR